MLGNVICIGNGNHWYGRLRVGMGGGGASGMGPPSYGLQMPHGGRMKNIWDGRRRRDEDCRMRNGKEWMSGTTNSTFI